jgi:hypothetical protein
VWDGFPSPADTAIGVVYELRVRWQSDDAQKRRQALHSAARHEGCAARGFHQAWVDREFDG